MKTLKFLALLVTGGIVFFGCEKPEEIIDDPNTGGGADPVTQDPVLVVDPTSVDFTSSDAGSQDVSFSVTNAVEGVEVTAVSSDESWLTATVSDASAESGTITLEVIEHTEIQAREATVTVSYEGAEDVIVTVTQAAAIPAPVLTVSPTSVDFTSSDAGSQEVSFSVTNAVEGVEVTAVSSDESWLTATVSDASAESGTITLNVTGNTATQAREATVTVSYEGAESVTIIVEQNGAPVLTVSPTSVEFTSEPNSQDVSFSVTNAVEGRSVTATSNQSWLTANVNGAGDESGIIDLEVDDNFDTQAREATVTVSYEGAESVTITVKQNGAPVLTVSTTSVEFTSLTGSQEVSFSVSNAVEGVEVIAESGDESWLTATVSNASAESGTITLNVTGNTATEAREAIVMVSYAGAESVTITVKQNGAPVLTVSTTSVEVTYLGGIQYVNFYVTNAVEGRPVTVTSNQDWLEAYTADALLESGTVTLDVYRHDDAQAREATVTVSYEGAESVTITVKQNGAPTVSIEPSEFTVYAAGGSYTFYITVVNPIPGVKPTVSCDADWISGLTVSGDESPYSVNFTVSEYTVMGIRGTRIDVYYNNYRNGVVYVDQVYDL